MQLFSVRGYSIKAILLLLLLGVLVPFLLVQAYSYYDHYQTVRNREFTANIEIARAAGSAFYAFTQGIVHQELALGMAATSLTPLSTEELARILMRCTRGFPAVQHFFWTDAHGRVQVASHPEGMQEDFTNATCFKRIVAGREWDIGDLKAGADAVGGSDAVFNVCRAIRDDEGTLLGVMVATVLADRLDLVLPVERMGDGGISLVDSQGVQVYQYPPEPYTWEQRSWLKNYSAIESAFMDVAETSTIVQSVSTGEDLLLGLTPIERMGWFATATRGRKEASGPVVATMSKNALWVVSLIAVGVVLSFALVRPIYASIAAMHRYVRAVGRGEPGPAQAAEGPMELRELTVAIDRMAEQVRLREKELRESEELFRSIVDNLTEGMIMESPTGRIVYMNPACLRMHGFSEEDAPLTLDEAVTAWETSDPEGKPIPPERWLHNRVLRGEQFQNVMLHIRRFDGRCDFYGSYNGVPILSPDGDVRFGLMTMRDETARVRAEQDLRRLNRTLEQTVRERTGMLAETIDELKNANQQLDQRARQLAALACELTMAEQRERKRLSNVLHDGLQPMLAILKMRLESFATRIDDQELRQMLVEFEQMLLEAIQISRSLSADLSPPALYEGGLCDGLAWLARRMRERFDFEVELSITERYAFPEDVKILVFESVRELLFNAVKHSKVKGARVQIQRQAGNEVTISVCDKGEGFDPARCTMTGEGCGGFGLFSIRERLGLIGGTMEIESGVGQGSCFTLRVPGVEVA